jgi:GNAT superfamily N-acetyltransferase
MTSQHPDAPAFSIEPAMPGDEYDIVAMIHELACYEKLEDLCVITPEQFARHVFRDSPACKALMVRVDGEPAGYAIYFSTFSTFLGLEGLYLEDLYVRPRFRRLGIGSAVMRHLASLAVDQGFGRMEWACLEWNELGKNHYIKMGAEPLEEWRTWRLSGKQLRYLSSNGTGDALQMGSHRESPNFER